MDAKSDMFVKTLKLMAAYTSGFTVLTLLRSREMVSAIILLQVGDSSLASCAERGMKKKEAYRWISSCTHTHTYTIVTLALQ